MTTPARCFEHYPSLMTRTMSKPIINTFGNCGILSGPPSDLKTIVANFSQNLLFQCQNKCNSELILSNFLFPMEKFCHHFAGLVPVVILVNSRGDPVLSWDLILHDLVSDRHASKNEQNHCFSYIHVVMYSSAQKQVTLIACARMTALETFVLNSYNYVYLTQVTAISESIKS